MQLQWNSSLYNWPRGQRLDHRKRWRDWLCGEYSSQPKKARYLPCLLHGSSAPAKANILSSKGACSDDRRRQKTYSIAQNTTWKCSLWVARERHIGQADTCRQLGIGALKQTLHLSVKWHRNSRYGIYMLKVKQITRLWVNMEKKDQKEKTGKRRVKNWDSVSLVLCPIRKDLSWGKVLRA